VGVRHAEGHQGYGDALPQGRQAYLQRDRILLECDRRSPPHVRVLPGQDRDEGRRGDAVIAYRAVPFLLLVAPPAIVLLAVLVGGCTMARTDQVDRARFYSDPRSRTGDELVKELDRRAAREELRRTIEETQR